MGIRRRARALRPLGRRAHPHVPERRQRPRHGSAPARGHRDPALLPLCIGSGEARDPRGPYRQGRGRDGMGVNFIKQFVAAGLSQDIQLIVPLWGSDQDIIRAVGDPMLGLFSVGHWSIDLDSPANRKFVAEFEKEYKRLPTGYAASGYDTALLIDSAIRKVKGRIENKAALRAALRTADFKSVRGDFKFGPNQFPVQNYYLQVVGKGGDGRLVHKTIGTVLTNRGDAYVQDCKMK